jgi:hypothetical protein
MDPSAFHSLKPTEAQLQKMNLARDAAAAYATVLEAGLPDGPDKTFVLRELRTVAMWVNVAITRHADGTPRS